MPIGGTRQCSIVDVYFFFFSSLYIYVLTRATSAILHLSFSKELIVTIFSPSLSHTKSINVLTLLVAEYSVMNIKE